MSGFEALVKQWNQITDELKNAPPRPNYLRDRRPAVPSNGTPTDEEVVETPQESAVTGDRWVNRGTHFRADMLEMIRKYSFEHRLESRQVVDMALRQFFGGQINE
jgi:hypothetical protein